MSQHHPLSSEIPSEFPVAQAIRERRTIRQFKSDPVSQELLLSLLDTANWAPNHGMREPWRFIQYMGEARRLFSNAVIGAMSVDERRRNEEQKLKDYMTIPVHLIVVMEEDSRNKQWMEDVGAVSSWIQCFQLAAWERGLGVVWKTNGFLSAPSFREAVGVERGEKIIGVLHVGYPEHIPAPRPRTRAIEKLTIHE
ncbi:Nitroreductase [Paenibacillus algorifonticola]|uniref:Putative NAD(P)H nitroreductase n=1 Tax=Paenibacillus algorifonticola TaxID=684063 RepID=A0A1I2HV35_9BACL|nr:nitroreductase [Paenibacillus algorifonticola]SFF33809.1 Nitroreductase [Paenibacillus algorifonticola]